VGTTPPAAAFYKRRCRSKAPLTGSGTLQHRVMRIKRESATSPEENKALVRRFYEEIDKGNLEAMDELVAEDYVDHTPPPFPGLAAGREGLKQAFKIFWEATPGYHRIEDQTTQASPPPGFRGCHCQARSACHRPVD
jgi:hypothetical protein